MRDSHFYEDYRAQPAIGECFAIGGILYVTLDSTAVACACQICEFSPMGACFEYVKCDQRDRDDFSEVHFKKITNLLKK